MNYTNIRLLAAGATGGRNELKFFESIPTWDIDDEDNS
jgi:hypothetical protein